MAPFHAPIPKNAITDFASVGVRRRSDFKLTEDGLVKRKPGRPGKNIPVYRVVDSMFSEQCLVVPIPEEYAEKQKNYAVSIRNGANEFCKPRPRRRLSVWRTVHDGTPVAVIEWVPDGPTRRPYADDVERLLATPLGVAIVVRPPKGSSPHRYGQQIRSHLRGRGLCGVGEEFHYVRLPGNKRLAVWRGGDGVPPIPGVPSAPQ